MHIQTAVIIMHETKQRPATGQTIRGDSMKNQNENNDETKLDQNSPAVSFFACASDGTFLKSETIHDMLKELRTLLSIAGFDIGAVNIGDLGTVRQRLLTVSNALADRETFRKAGEEVTGKPAGESKPGDTQLEFPFMNPAEHANRTGEQKIRDCVIPVEAVLKGIKL